LPGFGFFVEPIWRVHEGSNEGFMKPPRCRREGDSPLRHRGGSAKPSRSSRED
ncbi:unnamed protein product, partial [Ascophyllum nodosum]